MGGERRRGRRLGMRGEREGIVTCSLRTRPIAACPADSARKRVASRPAGWRSSLASRVASLTSAATCTPLPPPHLLPFPPPVRK